MAYRKWTAISKQGDEHTQRVSAACQISREGLRPLLTISSPLNAKILRSCLDKLRTLLTNQRSSISIAPSRYLEVRQLYLQPARSRFDQISSSFRLDTPSSLRAPLSIFKVPSRPSHSLWATRLPTWSLSLLHSLLQSSRNLRLKNKQEPLIAKHPQYPPLNGTCAVNAAGSTASSVSCSYTHWYTYSCGSSPSSNTS